MMVALQTELRLPRWCGHGLHFDQEKSEPCLLEIFALEAWLFGDPEVILTAHAHRAD